MKFNNSMWLSKDDYTIEDAKNAFLPKVSEDSVRLYSISGQMMNGMPIGGGLLTFTVSAPLEDVLSVKISNYKGSRKKKAEFQLKKDPGARLEWQDNENEYIIRIGILKL